MKSPILYLAFFKTILAALFRAFGRPLSFLPSKPSFLHDHSTTQHSGFSVFFFFFLAISATHKPVNRSIKAYSLTQLNVFALRGFIFRDIHKNKEGVRAIRVMKCKKYVAGKSTRARAPLAPEVHK